VINHIIPSLSGVGYITPINLPRDPEKILSLLLTPSIKLKTMVQSFLSFSFLPILSPSLFPHIFLNFASRFLTSGATRWDLGLHYNAEIAPTFAIATLIGLKQFYKKLSDRVIIFMAFGMILLSFWFNIYYSKGSLILAFHPAFYQHTKNFEFLRKTVSVVPKGASVSAQNNLASYFFHHKDVWILRENYAIHKPDYIVLDMREGQNPSGLLGINNKELLFQTISNDKTYEVVYNQGTQYVFKRVSQH